MFILDCELLQPKFTMLSKWDAVGGIYFKGDNKQILLL
jgi:hypothetical protein